MYPLNLSLPAPAVGFALAHDEAEHAALSEQGYEPKLKAAGHVATADVAEKQEPAKEQPVPAEAEEAAEPAPKKRGRPAKE